MKKILLIIGVVIVVGVVVILVLSRQSKPNEQIQSQESAKASAQNIINQVNQVDSGIKVPDNLMSCPEKYFEKDEHGQYTLQCNFSVKEGDYCSYYKVLKDGVEKSHNLQFTSECNLCRTHKQKGEVFLDGTAGKYTHLGYEVGKCYQGMYKGQ